MDRNYTLGYLIAFFLALFLSIAWTGTLIWAVIYVVSHLGEWLN